MLKPLEILSGGSLLLRMTIGIILGSLDDVGNLAVREEKDIVFRPATINIIRVLNELRDVLVEDFQPLRVRDEISLLLI